MTSGVSEVSVDKFEAEDLAVDSVVVERAEGVGEKCAVDDKRRVTTVVLGNPASVLVFLALSVFQVDLSNLTVVVCPTFVLVEEELPFPNVKLPTMVGEDSTRHWFVWVTETWYVP